MSLLLLDVGNTRLKWALWDGALKVGKAVPHAGQPIASFTGGHWPHAEQVWISCVPRLRDEVAWANAVQQVCGLPPHLVTASAEWQGLHNRYVEPRKLGVDRWLGMVALWSERRAPFCIVGAGTALTFDRVDAQGLHRGGLIAAGFGSMQQALLKVTVTDASESPTYHAGLGENSEAAIRQGAFFAAMGVIERALRAPGADAAEQRIITGGDAPALLPHLGAGWTHRPHLVLEGLAALARSS